MPDSITLSRKVEQIRQRYGFSSTTLKLFAIISMFVDHAAITVVPRLKYLPAIADDPALVSFLNRLPYYMRRFGRLAFPIFCFLIVEGYFHTRDVRKYAGRLALFALISEFPFDYALHHGQPLMHKQNVYFTLLIGLLVIWAVNDYFNGMIYLQLMVMTAGMVTARLLQTDYSYRGVFLIELLYVMRFSRLWQSICAGAFLQFYEGFPTPLSCVLTFFYNGRRGRPLRYFFYFFYPVHLLVLGIIAYRVIPMFW